ncbi:Mpo1-like protein [Francisella sp. 19X1-34]|uniref:Mpo1 family 2-hydroxy fatty acid dioxygenase n=1 Tax=Francisella sp. 19X1-34 TaxID=3087177 RepID=UPI002E2F1ABE|nr:Mpo1-like protein [Francisella sp. 19X1-34]MED7787898.1 Mpo1-like protein [Francisella sp. 19X1-34]
MRRDLQNWLYEYSLSHKNVINQKIHTICVPAITFSIIGILYSISFWLALILIILALCFYFSLSFKYAWIMLVASLIMLGVAIFIPNILLISIFIFIIGWALQFYGHHLEGKKPSFLKDVQFLLIGPLWVIQKFDK